MRGRCLEVRLVGLIVAVRWICRIDMRRLAVARRGRVTRMWWGGRVGLVVAALLGLLLLPAL